VRAAAEESWQKALGWLLTAALVAVIIFGYLMRATGYFAAIPGSIADDPLYNSFVLEHLYRVAGGSAELWNPQFFYPFKGVLAFSDNHLGSSIPYLLARIAGLPREHAFDAWFVTGTLLNFGSAFYAIRRFGATTAAAALGAFFFTFALPVPAQDGHAQLVYRFSIPLATLALWQMFERRRVIDLARVIAFTVWQFYCSIYLGLFLSYLLAALIMAIAVVRGPGPWIHWRANLANEQRSSWLAAGALLLVSAIAFSYLVGSYWLISQAYGLWRPVQTITELLPRPGSYLIADNSPLLSWLGRNVQVAGRWEHQLFIGFGATALIAAAVAFRRRSHAAPGLALSALIAFGGLVAGTLCIGETSLYHLIAGLPGIEGIRAVSRVILVMLMPLSLLVALGVDAIWSRVRTPGLALPVLASLAALVIVEPLSFRAGGTPIETWHARLDRAKALLPSVLPQHPILMLRSSSDKVDELVLTELYAMVLGQDLGYPVLNGHSGFHPPGYEPRTCASARERLRGYYVFMRGTVDVADYSRRLVVLNLGDCPPTPR